MKKSFLFFIFLFFISCLGQISSDVYLPALPTIQNAFNTTEHWMQLSLAIYMLGFSVSHLVYGPISDHVGRKNPLIIGITVCILGSILCRFANTIDIFVIGRFLQGFGAGAGAVLFLSITSDVYSGNALAKISAFLGLSRVVLLASAPLIGSYLLHFFSWRACFTFLFLYAALDNIYFVFMFTAFAYKFDLLHMLYVYIIILRITAALMVFTVQAHTKRFYLSRFTGGLEFLLLNAAMILSYCYPNFNLAPYTTNTFLLQCVNALSLQQGVFMKLALCIYFVAIPINIIIQFQFVRKILVR